MKTVVNDQWLMLLHNGLGSFYGDGSIPLCTSLLWGFENHHFVGCFGTTTKYYLCIQDADIFVGAKTFWKHPNTGRLLSLLSFKADGSACVPFAYNDYSLAQLNVRHTVKTQPTDPPT